MEQNVARAVLTFLQRIQLSPQEIDVFIQVRNVLEREAGLTPVQPNSVHVSGEDAG